MAWLWVVCSRTIIKFNSEYSQTCQHSRFGRESPDLKANSDLPSAFCFISQSPTFHKKRNFFFEKVVFHFTMKLSDLPGHKNCLHTTVHFIMTHYYDFFYGQIPVYNAFSELLETQIFQNIFWPLRANHGGPSSDTKLSETPSY